MADTKASDRWQRVDSLLEEALELEFGERKAFLKQACDGDKVLRGEVESLLKAVEASPTFFEEGALALATPILATSTGRPRHRRSRSWSGWGPTGSSAR